MSIELNFDSGYDLKDAIALDFYLDNAAKFVLDPDPEKTSGEDAIAGLILLATAAYHIADVFTDTRTAILNKQVKPTSTPDAPCSVTNPST